VNTRVDLADACAVADAVRGGEVRAETVMTRTLDAINARNPALNAFVHLDPEQALARARAIDAQTARGEDPGPLAGVPIGLKDLRDQCAGMPLRKGSLFHKDDPPAETDTVHVARLKAAGAIPVGMVATAEFGMDGVTHTRLFGTTRNPWDLSRTPSGSSGGSSSAVAGGLVPLCTASDAAGSTRCPAAYTGSVGMKPSMGLIPRADGFSDRSCLGAVTTSVRDWARYLDAVQGPDDRDRMSLPDLGHHHEDLIETLPTRGLKAAWSPDLGFAPVEPDVLAVCEAAVRRLVETADLELAPLKVSLTNTYRDANLALTEAFVRDLELKGWLPGKIDLLSPGPRMFVEAFYREATPERLAEAREKDRRLEAETAALFEAVDILFCPAHARTAYAAEGPLPEIIAGRDARETHAEPFTLFANTCWNPSISVPAGLGADSLPIGLLITVRRHQDALALRLARLLEAAAPWPRWARGYGPGWLDGADPGRNGS